MTIHGAPLSYSSSTINEDVVGIVPEKCILVIITPPQAVVYSSPVEDTETYRFFQQKNWIKTLIGSSPENCYGADKYVPSIATKKVKSVDGIVRKVGDDECDEDENEDDDVYLKEIEFGKIRKDNEIYIEDPIDLESVIFYNNYLDVLEDKNKFYKRILSNNSEFGFEILNNIQIFLPGDKFYNQWQGFDEKLKDFDAYSLGPLKYDYRYPYTGDKSDDCIIYGINTYEGGEVDILKKRENEDGRNWEEGDEITTSTHKVLKTKTNGVSRVKYFNKSLEVANHNSSQCKKTTQQILDYIMKKSEESGENLGYPKMIILNACSPSKLLQKKRTYKTNIFDEKNDELYRRMKDNLIYRGEIYWNGRKTFCRLRNQVKMQGDIVPLLPYWSNHNHYTRIDTEKDLEHTHILIGKIFEEEKNARLDKAEILGRVPDDFEIQPLTIAPEMFISIYTIASTDRRSTIMIHFRNDWIKLFGNNEKAYSWENMVDYWRKLKNSVDEVEENYSIGVI